MQLCIKSELIKWAVIVSVYKYPTTHVNV